MVCLHRELKMAMDMYVNAGILKQSSILNKSYNICAILTRIVWYDHSNNIIETTSVPSDWKRGRGI